MKEELDMLRPLILAPAGGVTPSVLVDCRRGINTTMNDFVHEGVLVNKFVPLSIHLVAAMMANVSVLLTIGREPDVESFIHATAELADTIRARYDEALRFNNMEDVVICAVMTEIMVKGVCVTLGLPYAELIQAGAADASLEEIKQILVKSGHIKEEEEQ